MKSLSLISRSYLINIDHPLSARINEYTVRGAGASSCVYEVRQEEMVSFYIAVLRFTIGARLVITGVFPSHPRETRRECMSTEEI